MSTPLPKNIVAVVQAARKLVHTRRDLREARASGEINERGLEKRSASLAAAIKNLDRAVDVLDREIAALTKRNAKHGGPSKPVPWASIFNAIGGFVNVATKASQGDPTTVREASRWAAQHSPGKGPSKDDDIIDAEIID